SHPLQYYPPYHHLSRPPPTATLSPYTTLFRSNTLIRSTMILSTSDTPETAASPTFATIMLSAIPTSTDKSCSITSGISKAVRSRSEEHTSELQSRFDLVCRLLLEKKKTTDYI